MPISPTTASRRSPTASTPPNTQTLSYDALDRLNTAVAARAATAHRSWTWDKVDNVKTQVIDRHHDDLQRSTAARTSLRDGHGLDHGERRHQRAGNITTLKIGGTTEETLTYNQANELASATTTSSSASYIYDLAGRRLEKTPATGYSDRLSVRPSRQTSFLPRTTCTTAPTADYILNLGNGRAHRRGEPHQRQSLLHAYGPLGTPDSLTDSARRQLCGMRSIRPSASTGISGVTGTLPPRACDYRAKYFDPETGFNHNGFRDYAGTLTRYVETDPIGLPGGMNTYQYVRANPFKYTDRRGEGPELLLPIVVGFGVVAVNQVEYFLYAITPPTTPASVPPPPPLPGTVNACTPNNPYGKQSMASPTGTFVYSLPSIPNRPEGPEEPPELPEIELK